MENRYEELKQYLLPGKQVHLIGIGGVSMSPLAEVLLGMGIVIRGSDMRESEKVESLRKKGIEVEIGHSADNIDEDTDFIVRTAAVHDENPEIVAARKMGIPVYLGHAPENIGQADLVVHTAAIMKDNVELLAAKQSNALVVERSILLGVLSAKYDNAVCICGTHGKTTSTAMLTQLLLDSGADPTAVIGGKLPSIGGNGRVAPAR